MTKGLRHVVVALAACGSLATQAAADPIPITVTVTGGSLFTRGASGFGFFTLTGDGFFLTGGADVAAHLALSGVPGQYGGCAPCPAGVTSSFDATAGGLRAVGPATFNGVDYPQTFLEGTLTFDGPSFNSSILSPANLTVTSPFSMTGSIVNFASSVGPPLFTASLVGSGIATAVFTESPVEPGMRPLFHLQSLTYQFGNPVPEPTSLLLLGSGLWAVLGRRLWRRRS